MESALRCKSKDVILNGAIAEWRISPNVSRHRTCNRFERLPKPWQTPGFWPRTV